MLEWSGGRLCCTSSDLAAGKTKIGTEPATSLGAWEDGAAASRDGETVSGDQWGNDAAETMDGIGPKGNRKSQATRWQSR